MLCSLAKIIRRWRLIKMDSRQVPRTAEIFTNLLWAHSPDNWSFKSTYFRNTLWIVIFVEDKDKTKPKKIRRSFGIKILTDRSEDLWGMARDCVEQIISEINNR